VNKSRETNIGTKYEINRSNSTRVHQELTLTANRLFQEALDDGAKWFDALYAAKMALEYIERNKELHPNWRAHVEYWRTMRDLCETNSEMK